jgi:hypothetical protein
MSMVVSIYASAYTTPFACMTLPILSRGEYILMEGGMTISSMAAELEAMGKGQKRAYAATARDVFFFFSKTLCSPSVWGFSHGAQEKTWGKMKRKAQ